VNSVSYDFTGARVIVTGGTSGIGHATATAFADAGAEVTVTGTRGAGSEYDVDLDRFAYRQLPMTDDAAIDRFVADIGAGGAVDVLVNNAGATFPGGRDEWRPDVFREAIDLNLLGAMRLISGLRGALADSTLAGGSSVVSITSMTAFRATTIVPGYGAAKTALLSLTRNLAVAWAGDGVRVNAIAAGLIDTPMTAPIAALPEVRDAELRHTPMGRFGAPREVAAAVLWLSSEHASYVTGSVLAVDGGYLTL
jgi:NAD(P)-dependent dehydrogenase (short-subunit alcohol dehydrogenase family)